MSAAVLEEEGGGRCFPCNQLSKTTDLPGYVYSHFTTYVMLGKPNHIDPLTGRSYRIIQKGRVGPGDNYRS